MNIQGFAICVVLLLFGRNEITAQDSTPRSGTPGTGNPGNDNCCTDLEENIKIVVTEMGYRLEDKIEELVSNVKRMMKKMENLEAKVNDSCTPSIVMKSTSCPVMKREYETLVEDGVRWRMFWWYKYNTPWPSKVTDVLQDVYGACDALAPYCFGRLPTDLLEDHAELLARDSNGNILRWKFNSNNNVSHQVWLAFHNHTEGKILHGQAWNPKTITGKGPVTKQDSFQYRSQNGVKSILLDDDNCDCLSTLSIGHGLCGASHQTQYTKGNRFGVEPLYDPGCNGPSSKNGLFLYFRDDNECANVSCPGGTRCVDGIHTKICEKISKGSSSVLVG